MNINIYLTKWKWILFAAILLLASVLRLYKLDQIPPGVNRDEASIGYTAYSLIHTGKDEYGKPFPVSFQSFGDWKLPLYVYLTVPFVKVFGLSELAVRLPSALAGITTVGLTFFLVRYFFNSTFLSFVSMFLLSISPWHVHLSRVESESNLAVLFTVVALLFFYKGLKRPIFFLGSSIFFALPYFAYHGNHVFTTLLLIGLITLFRSKILKTKETFFAAVIFLILVSFILSQTLRQADATKLSGISIFGNPSVIHEKIEIPRNRFADPNAWYVRLRYNRVTFAVETITKNYLSSFGPEFLFIRGGTNRAHNIQNIGNLYLIDAPFFYLGILTLLLLIFSKNSKKFSTLNSKLLLWWLLIAPVAASITKDAPHTNRMFAIYPVPPILIALGIQKFLEIIPKKIYLLGVIGLIGLYSLNMGMYLDRYFIQFPKNEAQYWGNIYADLFLRLSSPELMDKKVIMSHPEYSPYIFFLFYSKYDPKKYQETAIRYPPTEDAFVHVKAYDRFIFREIDWDKDMRQPNTVLVDFTKDIPKSVQGGSQTSIFTLVATP